MRTNIFLKIVISFIVVSISLIGNDVFAQNKVVKIWPGLAPGTEGRTNEEYVDGGGIRKVYQPDLTIFVPEKQNEKHPAVLVLPGGGYNQVVIRKEGYKIAQWLNENGITAFVLKYRLDHSEALQDAQRALSLIRDRVKEYGIDPANIGVIGFSAGGNLAANLATHLQKDIIKDNIDSISCKPNFMILVYGGGMSLFINDVNKDTAPTFLAHAGDDSRVPVSESIGFYSALKKNNVPAELHIYEKGQHGFAVELDRGDAVTSTVLSWTKRCIEWLGLRGILK